MIVYLALLVCIVGLVVYAISTNAKAAEIGRICFFTGLLAFLLVSVPRLVTVLK
jgi:Na+/phosphate symporter